MFLRWKKAILVMLLKCYSKHSRGSNRTPRFLTHALCGTAKPSNHSETVSNFFWSSFEPIIIISVFPLEGLNLLDLGWVAWELRKVGETIDDILWPVMTSYNINPSNEPSSQVIICFDTSFNQNVCWKAKQLHKKCQPSYPHFRFFDEVVQ